MKRREFITLLGATASWPPVARAPQPARMRRLGLLLGFAESDPLAQSWNTAFVQRLRELGWTEGRNSVSTTAGRWVGSQRTSHRRRGGSYDPATKLRLPLPRFAGHPWRPKDLLEGLVSLEFRLPPHVITRASELQRRRRSHLPRFRALALLASRGSHPATIRKRKGAPAFGPARHSLLHYNTPSVASNHEAFEDRRAVLKAKPQQAH
jgi:hypothetical protein